MSMPCQSCIPCTSETNLGCRCWCHLPSKNRCTLGFTFYFECTFCSSFGGQSWPGNAKRVYATSSLVCNWCTKKLDFVVQQTFHLMSAEFSIHTFPWGAGRIHFGFVYITVSLEYSESLRAKLNTSCYEPATTSSFPIMKLKGSKRLLRILGLWPRTSKDQDKWTLCWNMNEMCHVGVRVRVPGKQTERHV